MSSAMIRSRPGVLFGLLWGVAALSTPRLGAQALPLPILDVHIHAMTANAQGPPPLGMCAPGTELPSWDPEQEYATAFLAWMKAPPCADPIWSPESDDVLMERVLGIMDRRNIYGITSGQPPLLERWKEAGGSRVIPGLWFGRSFGSFPDPVEFRQMMESGKYRFFGEVGIQYDGMSPSDEEFDPYLAIAEELDIPVGIHIGTGPPGAGHLYPVWENYRARLHSPMLLDDAMARHPGLRVTVMHAGWPMIDDLIAVMWAHPQVYASVGVISYVLPRAEFHRYLRRIVEAGLGNRVMFGTDQMVWPDAIERAIDAIESAPFLTDRQKRDILFNNAARFLRLDEAEVRAMHEGR